MIALVRHDFGQWSVVQLALRPWVGCHRRQVRLGEQQIPKQRRGVPFVGVSQTHGDDGPRFQVDRVLNLVRTRPPPSPPSDAGEPASARHAGSVLMR